MSRLPWRPPAPGGSPTRRPPVVRLQNFNGPPELGSLILDALQGRIRQYYLKQAQNFAAGQLEYSKTHVKYPDLAMSYANVGGQEIVNVAVHPEAVAGILAKRKGPQPDWMVAEFSFATEPEVQNIVMYAKIRGKDEEWSLTPGTTNIAPFQTSEGTKIAFAGTGQIPDGGYSWSEPFADSQDRFRCGLLVDLRAFKFDPAVPVVVDVYAALTKRTSVQNGWRSDFVSSSGNYNSSGIYVGPGGVNWRYAQAIGKFYDFTGIDADIAYRNITFVTLENSPLKNPVSPTIYNSAEYVYREAVAQDPASGLLTQFMFSTLALQDYSPGNPSGFPGAHPTWDMWEYYIESFYAVSPTFTSQYPVRAGVFDARCACLFGKPPWYWHRRQIDSPSDRLYAPEHWYDIWEAEDGIQYQETREGLSTATSTEDDTIFEIDITDEHWKVGELVCYMKDAKVTFQPA